MTKKTVSILLCLILLLSLGTTALAAPSGSSTSFTDVSSDAYYYDAVLWAVENEITNGTSATTFDPEGTCTCAHILTFLHRLRGRPDATEDQEALVLGLGTFLGAIINFLVIALVLFSVIKAFNKARELAAKKEEEAVEEAPAEDPKPTTEELLGEILEVLKKQ